MREYGLLRLREAGEEELAGAAHLAFYARMCRLTEFDPTRADVATPGSHPSTSWTWKPTTSASPCGTAWQTPTGRTIGLAMAAGLGQYWRYRAVSEGARWIDALLAGGVGRRHPGPCALRQGTLAVVQGDHAAGFGGCHGSHRDRTPDGG